MRTKAKHKLTALFLSLAMVLTAVPFSFISAEDVSEPAEGTYVLDTTTDLTAAAAGTFADGDSAKAGTNDYFTLFYSAKTKIDSSNKPFDDGYTGTQRVNFGGKLDAATPKNAISFTTANAATVKVWWVEGGDDNRQITVVNKSGEEVFTSNETLAKNATCITELEIPAAGTYYLGGKENNNYFFKVEVAEKTTKEYVLDTTADLTAAAAGTFADGDSAKAGTGDYFTLYYSAKTKIDSSTKPFDDGYTGTQRVNFGGKLDAATPKNAISFTTANAATVKVWWVEGGDDNRQITIVDKSGEEVDASNETLAKNATCITELEVPAAGTYFLGGKENNNYFFKVEVVEHETKEYILDATADLTAAAAGTFADGDSSKAGTDNYFTLYYSAKTKIDSSKKTFDDGYEATQRINFGGKLDAATPKNAISFTTGGKATVKVWWVEGGDDNRQITIVNSNGEEIVTSNETLAKNATCITELEIPEAGTYFLGGKENNNYFFKVAVTEGAAGPAPRADWEDVKAPVITDVKQTGGEIEVTVTAEVGNNGGDKVQITMFNAKGEELETKQSLAEKSEHVLTFAPAESGKYSFKAILSRDDEETAKESNRSDTFDFVLPLGKTNISSATSKGGGKIEIVWDAVDEATGYNIYCGDEKVGTTTETKYTVSGLKIGESYTFTVTALRGEEESEKSEPATAKATEEEQVAWGFTIYGPSTSTSDGSNGYEGDVNNDGKVTVYSEKGKGKVQPSGPDGVAFYYAPISTDLNFTLRANVHVDSWTFSNGQDGFGLLALDSLPKYGEKTFWTNQYMAMASKSEYRWDPEFNEVTFDSSAGTKYTMRLGLGVNTKLGITPELLELINANDTDTIKKVANGRQYPLETTAADLGLDGGNYNIVGNATNADKTDTAIGELLTDFVFEIQRNNTGYFISYYTTDGKLVRTQKFYDTEALSLLDKDNVYVGFFASRNARATFSNVELTTIKRSEDDTPAEEKPVEGITPRVNIKSASIANSEDYTLTVTSNVLGKADIAVNGKIVATDVAIEPQKLVNSEIKLEGGKNTVTVTFKPDPDQTFEDGSVLASKDAVTKEFTVNYETYYANQKNLYVAPDGSPKGNGGPEHPLDIYTAISCVQPGQTIVVMEGTYNLESPVRIERGMDGTADKLITMTADPEAKSVPVFDFGKKSAGFNHGGSYWYFKGFKVANTVDGQGGFYVCGNNNTLDQIEAYDNGNTGIQIRAFNNSLDPVELWPKDNLILNCTSHNNADKGYEDADGFAAKLTVGEGNVFDGCVAYNNADDGWDLFAKVASGPIGAVTIKNCVAYNNGILEDGTNAGNGNGFKLGGDGLPGKHKLINSVAFNNKANGITSNSCPDVSVIDCTSYNNGGSNITLYTNNASAATDFEVKGLVSFRNDGKGNADDIKAQNQDNAKFGGDSNYYWNGSKSLNASNGEITEDMFVSLKFDGKIARSEKGIIDMNGFLALTDAAPEEAIGAMLAGTADNGLGQESKDITITPDTELPPVREDPAETTEPEETEKPEETTKSDEVSIPEETSKPEETTGAAGDTNNGNGNDKNNPTGLVFTVIPALLAGAAAIAAAKFGKKRK